MQPRLRHLSVPGFLLALLLALGSGCRSADTNFSRILNEPAPLPEPVRTSFGRVGVLPASASAEFLFQYPAGPAEVAATRSATTFALLAGVALAGAGHEEHSSRVAERHKRAESRQDRLQHDSKPTATPKSPGRDGSRPGSGKTDNSHQIHGHSSFGEEVGEEAGKVLVGLLAIGAVSLAEGLTEALFTGVSRAEVEKSEAALRRALRDDPLQPGIQTCLYQIAAKRTGHRLIQLPDSAFAERPSLSTTNGDYRALGGLGIDSVLVIRISNQGFSPAESLNRSLFFVAEAEVQVVCVADGTVLHAGVLDYQSAERSFKEWGVNDAKLLRAELKHAQQLFADSLLEQLFAAGP